jgi:hypothetical protein
MEMLLIYRSPPTSSTATPENCRPLTFHHKTSSGTKAMKSKFRLEFYFAIELYFNSNVLLFIITVCVVQLND